jgi:hypothetical protein
MRWVRITVFAIFAGEVLTIAWLTAGSPDPAGPTLLALAFLVATGALGESRHVRLQQEYKRWGLTGVGPTGDGLLLLLPLTTMFAYVANAHPVPSWFPTQTGGWLFVLWLAFGFLAYKREW